MRRRADRSNRKDDELWPIAVTICPWLYQLKPEHAHESLALAKSIAPVFVWANVASNGVISPYQAPGLRAQPHIPRELLEPSDQFVTLGKLQDADEVYAGLEQVDGQWSALISQVDELVAKVTGRAPGELRLDTHALGPVGCCVPKVPRGSSQHIQRLTDLIAMSNPPELPLYQALLTAASDRPLKRGPALLELSELHIGQMESRYPLSASQRESLLHQLELWREPASVLAVDGPPGTGKTTFLLSVIATLWVRHAVEGSEPPLIVASSTNNQAVLNILEAFSKVTEKDGALSGRWLPGINSYGQYLYSAGREEPASVQKFPIHTCHRHCHSRQCRKQPWSVSATL